MFYLCYSIFQFVILIWIYHILYFLVAQMGKNLPAVQEVLGEGNGYPLQYSCMENPYGQRSLVGYSAWDCKESDTTEQMTHRHVHQILLIHQLMDTFVFGLYDYCWYEC